MRRPRLRVDLGAARERILMISIVPPFPDDQGNRVLTRRLMDHILERGYDIDLILQGGYDARALRDHFGTRVEVFATSDRDWRNAAEERVRERIKNMALDPRHFDGYQQSIAREIFRAANHHHPFAFVSDRVIELVREVTEHRSHQSLICNYVYSLRPVLELRDFLELPRCAVITHDALSRLDEQALEHDIDTAYRACSPEVESDCLNVADVVAAITHVEAAHFARIGVESEIVVAEYGCFDEATRPPVEAENFAAKRLIFAGSDNPLNRQGIDEFLLRAWPRILAEEPTAELVVTGAISKHIPEHTPSHRALGVLSDAALLDAMRASSIVINPVTVGTGLKVKSVDAIALGLPLVCFATGAEGLEDLRDSALLQADDWSAFADRCIDLLRDPGLWGRVHEAARKAASVRFAERRVYDRLADAMGWNPVSD